MKCEHEYVEREPGREESPKPDDGIREYVCARCDRYWIANTRVGCDAEHQRGTRITKGTREMSTVNETSKAGQRPNQIASVKPHCCYLWSGIQCGIPAVWRIVDGPTPDDYTEACTRHVGEMLTDAPEHRVYSLEGLETLLP